jgi:hypothetical protein
MEGLAVGGLDTVLISSASRSTCIGMMCSRGLLLLLGVPSGSKDDDLYVTQNRVSSNQMPRLYSKTNLPLANKYKKVTHIKVIFSYWHVNKTALTCVVYCLEANMHSLIHF